MSREDELRDVLDKTADEIKLASGNPRTWLSWMVYLLAALEKQGNGRKPGQHRFVQGYAGGSTGCHPQPV